MEAVDDLIADVRAFGGFPFGPQTRAQAVKSRALLIMAMYGCPADEALFRAMAGEQVIPANAVHWSRSTASRISVTLNDRFV